MFLSLAPFSTDIVTIKENCLRCHVYAILNKYAVNHIKPYTVKSSFVLMDERSQKEFCLTRHYYGFASLLEFSGFRELKLEFQVVSTIWLRYCSLRTLYWGKRDKL
jgi:hypothetical protein